MKLLKRHEVFLIFVLFLLFIVAFSLGSLTTMQTRALATEKNVGTRISSVDGIAKEINNMFAKKVQTVEYGYNIDDSADYLIVFFESDGYAILYKDTLELMELSYSGNPYRNYEEEKNTIMVRQIIT